MTLLNVGSLKTAASDVLPDARALDIPRYVSQAEQNVMYTIKNAKKTIAAV
jgi:hypothetical protein